MVERLTLGSKELGSIPSSATEFFITLNWSFNSYVLKILNKVDNISVISFHLAFTGISPADQIENNIYTKSGTSVPRTICARIGN